MNLLLLLILGVLILVGAIVLIVIGSRYRNDEEGEDPLLARLAEYSQRGEISSLEEIELSQSFSERIIIPMMRRLGEISARFTPQKVLEETRMKLEMAGNPGRIDAATLLASRFVVAALLGGLMFLVGGVVAGWPPSQTFLVGVGATLLGFFTPQLWLTDRIQRRQKEIRNAMPDALDLLTICVEAGLGFDAAMAKVSEKWQNELSIAFARAIREVQLGKLRREALKDMSDRLGIPEMTSFIAAVIQSEQLGVSMAKVLRIQSEQMRMKRRQHAEEQAHKAPVKMLIPMAFLTFPSIFIILLAPAAFKILEAFSGGIGGG
ncbi:MAG: type II secretion system F family protein [Candidatus Villigracilaceae bacterium]